MTSLAVVDRCAVRPAQMRWPGDGVSAVGGHVQDVLAAGGWRLAAGGWRLANGNPDGS
jgi:hypothetical protein